MRSPRSRRSLAKTAGDTPFANFVLHVVSHIPAGRVATYGQIAAICGSPRAARQVGWTLRHAAPCPQGRRRGCGGGPQASRSSAERPPSAGWWRVIGRGGRITIVHPVLRAADQARRLRREGVRVTKRAGSYWVDLERYLWKTSRALIGLSF